MKLKKVKKHYRYFTKLLEGDKIPRKAKKAILGIKLNKAKIRKKFKKSKAEFCPRCGCETITATENMASYPEVWKNHYCCRCGFLVGVEDNSPYISWKDFVSNDPTKVEWLI